MSWRACGLRGFRAFHTCRARHAFRGFGGFRGNHAFGARILGMWACTHGHAGMGL